MNPDSRINFGTVKAWEELVEQTDHRKPPGALICDWSDRFGVIAEAEMLGEVQVTIEAIPGPSGPFEFARLRLAFDPTDHSRQALTIYNALLGRMNPDAKVVDIGRGGNWDFLGTCIVRRVGHDENLAATRLFTVDGYGFCDYGGKDENDYWSKARGGRLWGNFEFIVSPRASGAPTPSLKSTTCCGARSTAGRPFKTRWWWSADRSTCICRDIKSSRPSWTVMRSLKSSCCNPRGVTNLRPLRRIRVVGAV
jgi:hypothetical protein